jgi:hypothetical protein
MAPASTHTLRKVHTRIAQAVFNHAKGKKSKRAAGG